MSFNIKVIVGSTREGRFSNKAAAWVVEELTAREGVEVDILDLKDFDMPFFNEAISPSMKKEPYSNEAVVRFTNKIGEADAFIIVTPEYNHGPTAVLKNAMDWVSSEWNNKPVAFVSYGSVGGARSIEQMRLIAIELQMAPIRNAVYILGNDYWPVVMGDGDPRELFAKYIDGLNHTIDQLLPWTKVFKELRG